MPIKEYDENDVHECVGKSMDLRVKKHIRNYQWQNYKSTLQNPDKHYMETDTDQEVTLDPEALKNELADDESFPEFKYQMLKASDVLITDE